jgi:Inositol 1,3,4-trisphosphate 5/6-kinase pre-ATP-grasp domain
LPVLTRFPKLSYDYSMVSNSEPGDSADGVEFIPWQPGERQDLDIILHKLTEDIDSEREESVLKLQLLREYVAANPATAVVDPIDAVRKVVRLVWVSAFSDSQ